ncbi:hypothetical protein L1N85_22185 [Paenibacillus alkaliterrae]|uniref:CdaR family protein n=1 Tax=Paenibacillus alkaliterrae TaxID=320909 RepID=UPI001F2EFF64|nr:CdaR family protein [Paenibacillus alkaliterrae]MCF2941099.1 hypothetical protein [Paenibacillus alkaliterrae]
MDKWLNHPTALKIISIILGLLLWAVVHIDPDTSPQTVTSNIDTKTIEASVITADGLDEDKYVLSAMEPTVVRLDVQGRLTDLMRASSDDDYIVKVDLKDAKPGIQELPLTVSLPKGIQLVQMSPRTVTVQLEEILTKPFELQVVAEGKPADGFIAGTPTIIEPTGAVEVTLPKDDMSRIGVVSAEINVEGADKTVVIKKAKVVVYDSEGIEMTNAVVSPETVQVEVKVTPPFKTVPLQVRYTGSLPDDLSLVYVKPAVEQVTVYGDQKTLNELQIYDGVVLDLSNVKKSGSLQVKTQLVNGIKGVDPAEVTLEVVVAPIVTRTLSGLSVAIEGAASGLSAVIRSPADGNFDLTVSGAETVLSKLKKDDIHIIANVEGLEPGVHVVPLQVDVPPYVQTVLANGQTLTVSIELVDNASVEAEQEESEEVGGTPSKEPEGALPDPGGENSGSSNAANGSNSNS